MSSNQKYVHSATYPLNGSSNVFAYAEAQIWPLKEPLFSLPFT